MDNFLLWASVNGLSVNSSKYFFVSFTRSASQIGTLYNTNNSQLEGMDSMRVLGVIFDSKITFVNQIETVANKCLKTLADCVEGACID